MKKKVLIVDDVEVNRDMMYEVLKDEYDVLQAENGRVALDLISKYNQELAILVLDLVMPEIDGLGVLEEINKKNLQDYIPILVITGDEHIELEQKCLDYGVCDFIRKPYHDNIIRTRIKNLINLFQYKNHLKEIVKRQTNVLREKNRLLEQQAEKLENLNTEIIEILGEIVESRNLESGEHIKRVKGFSRILAYKMMEFYPEYALTKETVEMIASASALHDIGKISIPDHILLKPGKLTNEEFDYMKLHTLKGCDILNSIKNVWGDKYSKLNYEICRHHHERYDGKGYPDNLKGDEIPVSAQIVSVADVYDALVSERVYKKAFSKEEAFEMIMEGKCGTFSPKLLRCFQECRSEFENLADIYQNKIHI